MHTRLPRILTRVVAGGMAGDAEEGSTTYRVYGGSIFKRVANGVLDRQPHRMTVKDATRRSPPPHLSRPLCITLDLPRPQWGNTPAKCNVRVQRVGMSESWLPARVLVLGLSNNFCDWSSNELDFTLRLFFYLLNWMTFEENSWILYRLPYVKIMNAAFRFFFTNIIYSVFEQRFYARMR